MKHRLVLIEWEDSSQPQSAWQLVGDVKVATVRIVTVGWLIKDGKKVKGIVQSVGGLNGKTTAQVNGVMAIPTRCIISIRDVVECD